MQKLGKVFLAVLCLTASKAQDGGVQDFLGDVGAEIVGFFDEFRNEAGAAALDLLSDIDGGLRYGDSDALDEQFASDVDLRESVEIIDESRFSVEQEKACFVVTFKSFLPTSAIEKVADDVARLFDLSPDFVYPAINSFAITIPYLSVGQLKLNPLLDFLIDEIVEDYDFFAFQQQTLTGYSRIGAPNIKFWKGTEKIRVAVLDTGVDTEHPDLNIVDCVSFVSSESFCDDRNGHGTHVAGVVGGKNTGVAPGVGIVGLKVLDASGGGSLASVLAGMNYVLSSANSIDVINVSLGGLGTYTSCNDNCRCRSDPLRSTVCNLVKAGVVVVVAAGNNNGNSIDFIPANFDDVITVSAISDSDGIPGGKGPVLKHGPDDTLADFSNWGSSVDIAAPGVDIFSTWKNGPGSYRTLSGTSMAAPHVSGAVALYIARNGMSKSKEGVLSVKNGLLSLADNQKSYRGFAADRDNFPEPVLNVGSIEKNMKLQTVVEISVNKFVYSPNEVVSVSISVFDENGKLVLGLSSESFTVLLNGAIKSLVFNGDGLGIYTASLLAADLPTGTSHTLQVDVFQSGDTGSASVTFIINAPQPATVVTIVLDKQDYEHNDTHATVTVLVKDENEQLVSDLATESFSTKVNSQDVDLLFHSQGLGEYVSFLDLSALTLGTSYELTVFVSRAGTAGSASTLFAIKQLPAETHVALRLDKDVYEYNDRIARITVKVVDERARAVTRLGPRNFNTRLNGSELTLTSLYSEVEPGVYKTKIALLGLDQGSSHTLQVIVKRLRRTTTGTSGQTFLIKEKEETLPVLSVSKITYLEQPSRFYIILGFDPPVAGATIATTIYRDGKRIGSTNDFTGVDEEISFFLSNPSPGVYSITVDSLFAEGYRYDPRLNAADPGYTIV